MGENAGWLVFQRGEEWLSISRQTVIRLLPNCGSWGSPDVMVLGPFQGSLSCFAFFFIDAPPPPLYELSEAKVRTLKATPFAFVGS